MVGTRFAALALGAWLAVVAGAAVPGAVAASRRRRGAQRPKVCLVLSGGGARGAAHIGVLKVLEEYRVPIDCITGTSMGSLVGAAYASGMTVPEMEALTEKITFDLLFKETPPRQDLTIRRKQDELRLNLSGPQIGVTDKGEVRFAKGIVSGVQLETVLRELSRIKGPVSFDALPIPFRAVATDLVTGRPKVFDSGDLALAMRSSMSVPGAIAPAEVDGMMLVDGGLVNNLPVDVARGMGADIVIAVNLGTPLMKAEDIKDVLGITGQMIGILTEQNVQRTLASLKPTDILILPELGNYSAGDFDHMKSTWAIGEAAARKVSDQLRALSMPPDAYAAFQTQRTRPVVASTRPIDEIVFQPAPKRVNTEYMGTLMETQAGEPLDQAKLDRDLLRLYGTEDFEHVSYQLLESPSRRILNVQGVEKSWGPNYLRFGLGLSSDFKGSSYFDLLAQYRRTWMNSLGGEWYTDLALGRNAQLYSEFYQPLDPRQRFFVAPFVDLRRGYLDVYAGDTKVSEYAFPTATAGAYLGTQISRVAEFRLGRVLGRHPARSPVRRPAGRGHRDRDHRGRALSRLPRPAGQHQLSQAGLRGEPGTGQGPDGARLGHGLRRLGRLARRGPYRGPPHAERRVPRGRTRSPTTMPGSATSPRRGAASCSSRASPRDSCSTSGSSTGASRTTTRRSPFRCSRACTSARRPRSATTGGRWSRATPRGRWCRARASSRSTVRSARIYLGYGVGTGGNRAAYFFLGRP